MNGTAYRLPYSAHRIPLNPFDFSAINPVAVAVAMEVRIIVIGELARYKDRRRGVLSLSWIVVLDTGDWYRRGFQEVYAYGFILSFQLILRKSDIGVRQRLISPVQGNGSFV